MTSSRMCICGSAHVFVFVFTSSGFEHAHLGTNSPHIDVTHVAQAKIDTRYIAANCRPLVVFYLNKGPICHI